MDTLGGNMTAAVEPLLQQGDAGLAQAVKLLSQKTSNLFSSAQEKGTLTLLSRRLF